MVKLSHTSDAVFAFSYLPSTMQQYQGLKLNPLKIHHTLPVLAYLVIIRHIKIQGNCCVFRATVTGFFK
jgi:hypothetical protein